MRDEHKPGAQTAALLIALLMAAGVSAAGVSAAGGDPGLVAAARSQDAQQVRALLKQRVNANVRADDGSTALLWAAHWNDRAVA
jgi:ankyrin repeat protein